MKQKKQEKQRINNEKRDKKEEQLDEVHKAVAQAWHSHFNNARVATSEFDARRRNFQGTPSRFKLEASNKLKKIKEERKNANWNFTQSLWDSYEIVSVSKMLETGLIMSYDFDDLHLLRENTRMMAKKRRESSNSLRNLFNMKSSSRRFSDVGSSQRENSIS